MRTDLPTGHIALLMTDIEGSTRLLHRLGAEGYARAQAEHRELLRDAFHASKGVEVDTQGDAFFYVFPTTLACVQGAVAGTRALNSYSWNHGDPIRVRMGIHCGEPQPTDEGYVGMVVNLAARIGAIGHGGQILLSEASSREAEPDLEALGLEVRDLGSHRLKDIEQPERLFQIVIPELPADFPPPRSTETRSSNLPIPPTPFIGRSRQVAQVRDLLLQPATRTVTLLGPGGTGKSRLALRVADELLHTLNDGVCFVGLAAVREPDLVLPSIAAALGVKEESGRPLLDTLSDHLASKELLLLLDNFEQVQRAARDISRLQASCPGVKILTTSRQPLRISGERGFPVPPLGLPEADDRLDDLDAVAGFEAVRLFVERAQAARWDFELDADNVADVVAICRKLDALPLAIELATARLYSLSPKQLLKALKNRMAVLTGGAADLLDHQQTLRDLVAWSYDLLDSREQILWQRLAVFEGGGSMAAVRDICDPDEEYLFPLDLDSLVSKSLLNLSFDSVNLDDDDDPQAGQRVSMLETLRDYALEVLSKSDQAAALRLRHAQWFGALAEQARPALRGPDSELWLKRLDLDQANFRTAMALSLSGAAPAEIAAGTAGALWFYWYQRGQYLEGRDWLEQVVASEVPVSRKARSLLGLANLERSQNNPTEAKRHCLAALEGFEAAGDREGAADAQSQLGVICQYLGEMDDAENHLTAAVDRLREIGSRGRLSFSVVALGALKQLRQEYAEAHALYAEGLALGRELGDKNYIATGLVNVGEILQLQGKLDEAAVHIQESLALFHTLGVRNAIAYCLEMLAGIELDRQHYADAALYFGAADRLREELNTPIESFNQQRYQQDLQRARDGLGQETFDSAFAAGRTRLLVGVVSLAQAADS